MVCHWRILEGLAKRCPVRDSMPGAGTENICGGLDMLKIICPNCMSDQIVYTATLDNGDDYTETFLCTVCEEDFSEGRICFESINLD